MKKAKPTTTKRKAGHVLDFDEAIGYLTELLDGCDGTLLASCILLAAHARNTSGTPGRERFLYARGLEGQRVELVEP
jgi:hypothetical protein